MQKDSQPETALGMDVNRDRRGQMSQPGRDLLAIFGKWERRPHHFPGLPAALTKWAPAGGDGFAFDTALRARHISVIIRSVCPFRRWTLRWSSNTSTRQAVLGPRSGTRRRALPQV